MAVVIREERYLTIISMSTCGRDKGFGSWVQRAASWRPDICPPHICAPVLILQKEFRVEMLAATASASLQALKARAVMSRAKVY